MVLIHNVRVCNIVKIQTVLLVWIIITIKYNNQLVFLSIVKSLTIWVIVCNVWMVIFYFNLNVNNIKDVFNWIWIQINVNNVKVVMCFKMDIVTNIYHIVQYMMNWLIYVSSVINTVTILMDNVIMFKTV